MKKNIALIFTTALILNLLPQTSDALRLSKNNNSVIYDAFKGEKEEWEKIYLPHAIHSKLVGRNVTVLDIAKMAQEEQEKNISAYTIIHKIIDISNHERSKMLVKWERDNGYIDKEGEEDYEITPTLRCTLLKEIDEEEERESEKTEQFSWKKWKARGKVVGTIAGVGISMFVKKDIWTIAAIITLATTAISTGIDVAEIGEGEGKLWGIWNGIKQLVGFGKPDSEEEIKLPPLRNMPVIPADHKKIDIRSL